VAGLKKANGASGTGVFGVVAAEGHDLVGEHRRQQPDPCPRVTGGQRDLRAGELEVRERDALDDVQDELVRLVALDRSEGYVPVDGEPGDAHGILVPLT
jgi:hypothetical protein